MRALDHQLLAVNGINLSLYSAGPADGRPLWLLHGFPECWLSWRHLVISCLSRKCVATGKAVRRKPSRPTTC